jgi:hypothetical protein
MNNNLEPKNLRHSRAGGNPVKQESTNNWIPGRAGNDEVGVLRLRWE